jgi:superfamily II DNA or RNA helicase
MCLAHTHHLLEQACDGLEYSVGTISEPKNELRARVVSGAKGHSRPADIKPSDDIIIATIQTIYRAYKKGLAQFNGFLKAANGGLFVVLDEAHHAPAPTYRQLLLALRDEVEQLRLLGLTATPHYTDERKRGWLIKVFPQGIIYQISVAELMAARVLSKPTQEQARTKFDPVIDEREYQNWLDTNRDIPEEIITKLAHSHERNDFIISTYVNNKERYGKTIIFADRWFQCDYLREGLIGRGVDADVIYSHIDADPGSAEARNRRTEDENSKNLKAFRENELDVLINVRMLTEGTDVPDTRTVFITRQTTSEILLTQMVGRALRGPVFGGTEDAYLVFFVDDWKELINWAEWEQIAEGFMEEAVPYSEHPPMQMISIDLVRELARQMDTGRGFADEPFLAYVAAGWYSINYQALVEDEFSDDLEDIRKMILVYEDEIACWQNLIDGLKNTDLEKYSSVELRYPGVEPQIEEWFARYLGPYVKEGKHIRRDIYEIVRHMGQNDGEPPKFFKFKEREKHNIDNIAKELLDLGLGRREERDRLLSEFDRADRYWKQMFIDFDRFYNQYNLQISRLMKTEDGGIKANTVKPLYGTPENLRLRELNEDQKKQVKSRDGYTCLACRNTSKRSLQIDHILPFYKGGNAEMENSQTLCKSCNRDKGDGDYINFRVNSTRLDTAPESLRDFDLPIKAKVMDPKHWEIFLTKTVNFFYECGAVESVIIGKRGEDFYDWEVNLYSANDPSWLEPFLVDLLQRIYDRRNIRSYNNGPNSITISAPGYEPVKAELIINIEGKP